MCFHLIPAVRSLAGAHTHRHVRSRQRAAVLRKEVIRNLTFAGLCNVMRHFERTDCKLIIIIFWLGGSKLGLERLTCLLQVADR